MSLVFSSTRKQNLEKTISAHTESRAVEQNEREESQAFCCRLILGLPPPPSSEYRQERTVFLSLNF